MYTYTHTHICVCVCTFLVIQLCLSFCRFLCQWDFPGKNTGVGSHSLHQGISLTQGSNLGLLHCRWILYCLSPQGSPCVCVCVCVCARARTHVYIHTYLYRNIIQPEKRTKFCHLQQSGWTQGILSFSEMNQR